MRTTINSAARARGLRSVIAAAAGVALLSGSLAQAQPFTSPAGATWDCVLSGARSGVAFLTFTDEGNTGGGISGYEVVVPRKFAPFRTNYTGVVLPGRTNNFGTATTNNIYGYLSLTGRWAFTAKGNLTGFIDEDQGFNLANFTGKVRSDRLTLVEKTTYGSVTLRGLPTNSVPDLTGGWSGVRRHGRQTSLEFFTMEQFSVTNEILVTNTIVSTNELGETNETEVTSTTNSVDVTPFLYVVHGAAAGYTLEGTALLSSQKRLAIVDDLFSSGDSSELAIRAVSGAFNAARRRSTTLSGIEGPPDNLADGLTNRISYRIQRLPTGTSATTP